MRKVLLLWSILGLSAVGAALADGMPAICLKVGGGLYQYSSVFNLLMVKFSESKIIASVISDESKCDYVLVMKFSRTDNQNRLDAFLYDKSGERVLWKDSILKGPRNSGLSYIEEMVKHLRDEYLGTIRIPQGHTV